MDIFVSDGTVLNENISFSFKCEKGVKWIDKFTITIGISFPFFCFFLFDLKNVTFCLENIFDQISADAAAEKKIQYFEKGWRAWTLMNTSLTGSLVHKIFAQA